MMNWNSNHLMGNDDSGSFWHEFKFEEKIPFSGIKLKSQIGACPRSFDIKIDGEIVYSTKEATELKGQYKEMNIYLKEVMIKHYQLESGIASKSKNESKSIPQQIYGFMKLNQQFHTNEYSNYRSS